MSNFITSVRRTILLGTALLAGAGPAHVVAEVTAEVAAEKAAPLQIASPALSPAIYIGRQLVQAIYRQAGLPMEFVALPFARSIFAAETGQVDGEMARAPSIVNESGALLPLAEPLTQIELVTVRHRQQPPITHMTQLQGLRIGHLNGMRTIAAQLEKDALTTVPTNNEQLLELLDRKRLDVVLMMKRDAEVLVRHHSQLSLGPTLITLPIYHYVHARHRALVPRLSAAQKALAADGALLALETQARGYLQARYTAHQRVDDQLTQRQTISQSHDARSQP